VTEPQSARLTNGPGAAAILSSAIGCFVLGILALAGDAFPAVARALNVWKPTGPLSGVTDLAIIVWLLVWFALAQVWARQTVDWGIVKAASFAMFIGALLLTFPPFMDLLQGK
jgi:hypothetical protein